MIHINSFLDKIRLAETRADAKFIMSLQDAKNLHNDITTLLLALHELSSQSKKDEIQTIELTGKDW